jgi:hypothetical protein
VDEGRVPVSGAPSLTAQISGRDAEGIAGRASVGTTGPASLAILGGAGPARLVWTVLSDAADGPRRTLVDARSGRVLRVENLAQDATASGRVFDPSPVVSLRDEDLTDKDDTNYRRIRKAYRAVTLTNLDGSKCLHGDFADIKLGNDTACSQDGTFVYTRTDDRFEQVMSYYDVTEAQRYIQSLGFNDVNNEPQDLLPDTFSGDNSFYSPSSDSITYGTGGVDDAEDLDIILHEYGHAIQDDQVPGFGSSEEAGSIGEGFGDYWGVTMSQPVNGDFEVPCVGDWDSTSYTQNKPHCLRRVDLDLTVADKNGEVHHDGQIWSRALWDINQALGRDKANTIILEGQFSFAPNTSFAAAALNIEAAAASLFGRAAKRACKKAFADRGIG